jgi:tetratricopeptide (TPR) repeat protein
MELLATTDDPQALLDEGIDILNMPVDDGSNVDESISLFQSALSLNPDALELNIELCFALGCALLRRFESSAVREDIENAVVHLQHGADLAPDGHILQADLLGMLSRSQVFRFQIDNDLNILSNAVKVAEKAVEVTPDGDEDKAQHLHTLSEALLARFRFRGDVVDDIDRVILYMQRAVNLTPAEHPFYAIYLSSLSTALQMRYAATGKPADLERAVVVVQSAVNQTLDGYPPKADLYNNLATAFLARFSFLHEDNDIDQAISSFACADELMPDGHPNKARLLSNLGIAYQTLFERRGQVEDLKCAIGVMQRSVDLISDTLPSVKVMLLSKLGVALRLLFICAGAVEDIDRSVFTLRRAVSLAHHDDGQMAHILSNFCVSLTYRYQLLNERDDVKLAISVQEQALDLTSSIDIEKPIRLNNLGNARLLQFLRYDVEEDLQNAITFLREAAETESDNRVEKPAMLSNFGVAMTRRFERFGELDDLTEAIRALEKAGSLLLDQGYRKLSSLQHLSRAHLLHFIRTSQPKDIDLAIASARRAVELATPGQAMRGIALLTLGIALSISYGRFRHEPHFTEGACALQDAVLETASGPRARLTAALNWSELCIVRDFHVGQGDTDGIMEAYAHVVDLIPQIVWLGHSLENRFEEVVILAGVVNAAAAAAIARGELTRALEWLEAGRGVIWSQLRGLRSPMDEVRARDPELAAELEQVSLALDVAQNGSSDSLAGTESTAGRWSFAGTGVMALEGDNEIRRSLSVRYEQSLQRIRELPGLENFLQPRRFSDLIHAARDGFVVVVNIARMRCDALLLQPSGGVISVPLPEMTQPLAESLYTKFVSYLMSNDVRQRSAEDGSRGLKVNRRDTTRGIKNVLGVLWLRVVQPILGAIPGLVRDFAQ